MADDFQEKSRWLARNILPHEPLIRDRLRGMRVFDLEIDDVVQETYARIISLPSFDTIRHPRQYAIQTATSIVIDHIRRSRVISIKSSDDLERFDIADDDASPDMQLEFRDEIVQVSRFLALLPPTTRETLIKRRVEGLSQKEVAEALGISVKTVEKHMARGTLMLMELFGRGGKSAVRSSKKASPASASQKKADPSGE
jgi:RNA polymerase sigma-70 factor (ECF subfamily)